ncbi:MAG TPA: DUF1570 domain-containing protein [Pirellulales bacterium]|nr:DUF1570 domain-containing protein [Pirellulales bacterium]
MKLSLSLLDLLLSAAVLAPLPAAALDHVELRRDGHTLNVSGRVEVTAEDGGLLLLAPDGRLWSVLPDELVERRKDDAPFAPLAREALAQSLLKELPSGFDSYQTTHYLICYNTSREYAKWCGSLFEQLYRGFTSFWSRKGMKLTEPEFPLVAIIFRDRDSYVAHARAEVGKTADTIIGYYSLQSNRMTMYDLTGVEALQASGQRRSTAAQINALLAQPQAEPLVATIIHEATHQIAFNSGLQTRFADIPLWVSEGIAVYFETPDLNNSKGWKEIGAINRPRLERFREYLTRRPADSLSTLISDDARLRNADGGTALDAYAEAWALNYYLIRNHSKEFVAYLKMLSEKRQLLWDDPTERRKEFQAAFGDLSRLDADFLRQMQRVH